MFYRIISRKLPDNRSILKVDYKMFYHLCWGTRLICRRRPGNISRIKYVGKPPKQQQINPKKNTKKQKPGDQSGASRLHRPLTFQHVVKKGDLERLISLKLSSHPLSSQSATVSPLQALHRNVQTIFPGGFPPGRHLSTCGVQPAMQLHTHKKLLRLATCGTTFHWLHLKRFLQEEDVLEEKQTSEYEGRPLLILFHVPKVHFSRFNNNNIKNNNTIYLFIYSLCLYLVTAT